MDQFTVISWIILICGVLAAGFMTWVFCMFTQQLANPGKSSRKSESTELRVIRKGFTPDTRSSGIWW